METEASTSARGTGTSTTGVQATGPESVSSMSLQELLDAVGDRVRQEMGLASTTTLSPSASVPSTSLPPQSAHAESR